MNYSQTIEYLYNTLPMYSRVGAKAIKPDLRKTGELCRYLANPEKKFKCIHIAGTNGKGSVSHMLAAIFQEQGFKTGLYTSPHLRDFRERIRINGKVITRKAVIDFMNRTRDISGTLRPSFFELTFGMAMDYFAREKVDIAIIETGLGGRLDSTNVVTPELSVITNIGWDHMDILGDTLEKIASEKAGIIKRNVPVVIGESLPETRNVFLVKAKEMKAPVYFAQENFEIVSEHWKRWLQLGIKQKSAHTIIPVNLDLKGVYQKNNILTVLQSVEVLKKKFALNQALILNALSKVTSLTGLQGRWQILRKKPTVILDVAHNTDGIRQVIQQLSAMKFEKLHIITGMVKDKDVSAVLSLWPNEASYYFTNAHIPRALPAVDLKDKASAFGLKGDSFPDVNLAIDEAFRSSGIQDLILVCGSVFVVGEVDVKKVKHLQHPSRFTKPLD